MLVQATSYACATTVATVIMVLSSIMRHCMDMTYYSKSAIHAMLIGL